MTVAWKLAIPLRLVAGGNLFVGFILISCWIGLHGVTVPPFLTSIASVRFGWLEEFITADGYVSHLEEDKLHDGFILFSDSHCLKTSNGTETKLIAGKCLKSGYLDGSAADAEFRWITGFVQINKTHILVADNGNHCLRVIDRVFGVVSPLIGLCNSPGLADGAGAQARFNGPYSVIRKNRGGDIFLVTDKTNNLIRQVDLDSRYVTTLNIPNIKSPAGLTYFASDNLVVANAHFLSFSNSINHSTVPSAAQYIAGFRDGAFPLFSVPREVIALNDVVMLVADDQNHRIRVLDRSTSQVHSICTGSRSRKSGDTSTCQLASPRSLFFDGRYLYVGMEQSIMRVAVNPGSGPGQFCPRDIVTVLQKGQKTAQVTIPTIENYTFQYGPGTHSVKIPLNNCTIRVTVKDGDVCPANKTVTLPLNQKNMYVETIPGMSMLLGEGRHISYINTSSSVCVLEIEVKKGEQILVFEADYNIDCRNLVNFAMAENIIQSIAQHLFSEIEKLCSGSNCKKGGNATVRCNGGKVVISWPTNFNLPNAAVLSKVTQDATDYYFQNVNEIKLMVYTPNLSFVNPDVQSSGLPFRVVLKPA